MENKMIIREAIIRQLTPENIANREAEFVISSEAEDTYKTVFLASGCDLKRYNNNPIVAYGHRTWSDNPDMILGTSKVFQEDTLTIGKVRFEEKDVNETAETIWKKVQAGTLRMASIGANILEWRQGDETKGEDKNTVYFTRWELLEWSIVPIGSNPDALKRSHDTMEEIRKAITKEIPVVIEQPEDRKRTVREAQLIINQNSYKK